jgi:YidC/Oxa1 family membrane protein insertase
MMVSTFTGPAVYTDAEKYQKIDFGDVAAGKAKFSKTADNGWLAMVQHYFVSAWVPQEKTQREFYMRKAEGSNNAFQAGVIVPVPQVAPGGKAAVSVPLYAGPQEQDRLEKIAPGLELVVDYGWLTIVAAPIFWALEAIHKLVGNWGWAIVILTIAIKAIFYPLSAASYKSMAKMKTLTPRLMQLKERFADDRQRLNQEMMKMYQTEKVNPLGGCLPILVQIPVFIALYWVLLGAVEMRDAPWILWIKDLASADPYYILPVVMVVTMVLQTKLNPTPPDPIQAKVMMMMPFIFGFMFFWFPAGLVLYWVVNNVLSIAQQWHITRAIEAGGKAANDAKA